MAVLLALLVLAQFGNTASAVSVTLTPVADTTLSENYPSNNLGGLLFVNSGTTQNLTRNHGLFRFDIAGNLPPGAIIRSASLSLEVTQQPAGGYAFADFGLYRLLQSWGEGSELSSTNGTDPGSGSLASTNEATWYYRFAFTTNTWAAPGGAPGVDYVPTASAVQTVYGVADSPYLFGPSTALSADVQDWEDHPQANYGWMLLCSSEGTAFTARRFGSHENIYDAPQLTLDYIVPPRFDSVQKAGTNINLAFTAYPSQGYVVQYSEVLPATNWQALAVLDPPPSQTNVVVVDPATAPRRFYRLVTN